MAKVKNKDPRLKPDLLCFTETWVTSERDDGYACQGMLQIRKGCGEVWVLAKAMLKRNAVGDIRYRWLWKDSLNIEWTHELPKNNDVESNWCSVDALKLNSQ